MLLIHPLYVLRSNMDKKRTQGFVRRNDSEHEKRIEESEEVANTSRDRCAAAKNQIIGKPNEEEIPK